MDLPSATIPSYYCEIQRFMGLKTKLGCQSLVLPGLRWSKSPGRPMSTHMFHSWTSGEVLEIPFSRYHTAPVLHAPIPNVTSVEQLSIR